MTRTIAHGPHAFVRLLAVAGLALALTGLIHLPAHAQTVAHWAVTPADADGPDDRISLRHVADPGEVIEDAVAVTNLGEETTIFDVAAGDGLVGPEGAFDIAAGEPVDSGAWITVDGLTEGTLELAAGETRVLPVTIAVPEDALPGDHPAGIVVGVSSAEQGITMTHRVGVRLHLQVSGELVPALAIENVQTTYQQSWIPFTAGTLTVTYDMVNTGNVRLGANLAVTAAAPGGVLQRTADGSVEEVLPGTSVTRTVELGVWPLFVTDGDLTAQPLSIGADQVALPDQATASFSAVTIPWTSLAAVALLALVVALRVRSRRAGSPHQRAGAAPARTAPAGAPAGADRTAGR